MNNNAASFGELVGDFFCDLVKVVAAAQDSN